MVPPPLAALIREHRDHHHVFYPPLGNADHGPMAYLALHGLGASQGAIAYSCKAQAIAHADRGYEWVAARYLAPRLSPASQR